VRHTFTAQVRALVERIAGKFFPAQRSNGRAEAIVTMSTLVGALLIARAVDDPFSRQKYSRPTAPTSGWGRRWRNNRNSASSSAGVMTPQARARNVLPAVLFLLFATGWAANHFAAMLPVFASSEGLSHQALDGAFGIYAVGLLPALLGGGSLSDRLGRRPLLLSGAAVAGLGNLSLLCVHDQAGIFIGRLIVGAGVGVAMSAGTAWSAEIGGGSGSVLAGVS
jgi:Na+/melibiose symporter-like transporter